MTPHGLATAVRLAGHDMLRIGRGGSGTDGSEALVGYMDNVDRVTGPRRSASASDKGPAETDTESYITDTVVYD
jgi:hypothetical protein